MTIKSNAGPVNGGDVVRQALAARMPQAKNFSTPLGGAPQTGSPVPFYHLSLAQLDSADPLASATITGWRYPVVGGINPGLVDVREGSNVTPATFAGLIHGIMVQRFMQASLLAEQTLASQTDVYQPRLLDVPALQFAALWLHGTSTNYFISLLDGHPLGSAPLVLVSDVLPDLRARATARTAATTPTGGAAPRSTPTN